MALGDGSKVKRKRDFSSTVRLFATASRQSGSSGARGSRKTPGRGACSLLDRAGWAAVGSRLPSTRWPTRRPRRRWNSSSRRSGPSSPGSVITFDPDTLEKRVGELEQELGSPGFWDDTQRAARVSAEPARLSRGLERYPKLLQDSQ